MFVASLRQMRQSLPRYLGNLWTRLTFYIHGYLCVLRQVIEGMEMAHSLWC